MSAVPEKRPKLKFSPQQNSDDHVISRVVTESARCRRTIGLKDLSRQKLKAQGTALH